MDNQKELFEKLYLANLKSLEKNLDAFPRLKYAMAYHRNIKGQLMKFFDKPYLVEIYKDTAREIILQSSVQTGKSEFLIVSAHSWAEKGLQVLYVLPTTDLRNTFVANRVDKLYEMSPYYHAMLTSAKGGSNARGLKHYGPNFGAIFFAGSNSATTFIEKPIDLVIGDETDRFDLTNYEKADDRMTASEYKLKYEASNPTVDNFGINARWNVSDQREWYVQCGSCNLWQKLDFFKNVVRQTDSGDYILKDSEWTFDLEREIRTLCARCEKDIDRFTHKSQWIAKYPRIKDTHGYQIHQMLSSYVKVTEIWNKFQKGLADDTAMQVFYNSVLGLPFAGKGAKITDEILNSCIEDYTMPVKSDASFMGIDVGKKLHTVIFQLCPGEKLKVIFVGFARDFEELDILIKRYNVVTFTVDSMPETRKSLELVKRFSYKGWMCRYQNALNELRKDEDSRIVSVDRTMIMDKVMKFFTNRQVILPKNAATLDNGDFYTQMKTPTRIFDEERQIYNWRGDPDHYYHAFVYAVISYVIRGEFKVIGLNPLGSNKVSPPPETLPEAVFGPGMDNYKVHYGNLLKTIQNKSELVE